MKILVPTFARNGVKQRRISNTGKKRPRGIIAKLQQENSELKRRTRINEQLKSLQDLIPAFDHGGKYGSRNPTKEEILLEASSRIRELEEEKEKMLIELAFFKSHFFYPSQQKGPELNPETMTNLAMQHGLIPPKQLPPPSHHHQPQF
jgi:hypothetical protein